MVEPGRFEVNASVTSPDQRAPPALRLSLSLKLSPLMLTMIE
jgi:hypothetical protein